MKEGHRVCDNSEWRAAVRDQIIPWAVGTIDLGDDVLEIGPRLRSHHGRLRRVAPSLDKRRDPSPTSPPARI